MKEIKFRGQRVDNKEWVYGYYYEWHSKYSTNKLNGFIHEITYNEKRYKIVDKQHEIILETVGQFTGRKDKYGRDIYEGDIIKHQKYLGDSETETITIESLEQFFGDLRYEELELAYDWNAETMEIIGNKFKNPELFEEEGEK